MQTNILWMDNFIRNWKHQDIYIYKITDTYVYAYITLI